MQHVVGAKRRHNDAGIIEDDVIGVIKEDGVIGIIGVTREDVCLAVLFISWLRGTMLLTVSAKLLA